MSVFEVRAILPHYRPLYLETFWTLTSALEYIDTILREMRGSTFNSRIVNNCIVYEEEYSRDPIFICVIERPLR